MSLRRILGLERWLLLLPLGLSAASCQSVNAPQLACPNGGDPANSCSLLVGPCHYGITAPTGTVAADGGDLTVAVVVSVMPATMPCQWTASITEGGAYATIVDAKGGETATRTDDASGNVTVRFKSNDTITPRTVTLSIKRGSTALEPATPIPLIQVAQVCKYNPKPPSLSLKSEGDTQPFRIETFAGCTWQVAASGPEITIVSPATRAGSGVGDVEIQMRANTTAAPIGGFITIVGQAGAVVDPPRVVVIQDGLPCNVNVPLTAVRIQDGDREPKIVTIEAPPLCEWHAMADQPFIQFIRDPTGTGHGSISFQVVERNPLPSDRSATITIGNNRISVIQEGPPCALDPGPLPAAIPADGGTGNVSVSTLRGCKWEARVDSTVFKVAEGVTGDGNGSIAVAALKNPDAASRTARLTITSGVNVGRPLQNSVTITQSGQPCTLTLKGPATNIPGGGGTGAVEVTTANGCPWLATSSDSAVITITSAPPSATTSGSIQFKMSRNPLPTLRSGTITFRNHMGAWDLPIMQDPAPSTASASLAPLRFFTAWVTSQQKRLAERWIRPSTTVSSRGPSNP